MQLEAFEIDQLNNSFIFNDKKTYKLQTKLV